MVRRDIARRHGSGVLIGTTACCEIGRVLRSRVAIDRHFPRLTPSNEGIDLDKNALSFDPSSTTFTLQTFRIAFPRLESIVEVVGVDSNLFEFGELHGIVPPHGDNRKRIRRSATQSLFCHHRPQCSRVAAVFGAGIGTRRRTEGYSLTYHSPNLLACGQCSHSARVRHPSPNHERRSSHRSAVLANKARCCQFRAQPIPP